MTIDFARQACAYQQAIDPIHLERLASQLGVSSTSLRALGIGWTGSLWAFPERDADGQVIGLATRDGAGAKKSITGSRRGLTLVWPLDPYAGSSLDDPILIVEGPSDAAAAIDLGYTVVGRPSAMAGLEYLRALLKGRHIVIVAENDKAGRQGAQHIAQGLVGVAASVRIVCPPEAAKDLRAWRTAPNGCDRAEVDAAIRTAEPIEAAPTMTTPSTRTTLLPYAPFPLAALPEPVKSFVANAAASIGCDPAFVALPLLSALASAIGNTRRVEVKAGWTEPSIIWTVIVGDSGTKKSPAIETALRVVRARQHLSLERHARAMNSYQAELLQYEKALARWKQSKVDTDPPTCPSEPQAERYWCDDTTVEAVAAMLQANPRGLLMARDELGGWLSAFDRYAQSKGGDVAKWIEMFGGRPMVVDRKTGQPRVISIPYASVSIAGGIQPEPLRRALGVQHREDGLASRLLMACPPRIARPWTEDRIDPTHAANLERIFDALYSLQGQRGQDGVLHPVTVPLTPSAKALWIDFFNDHAAEHVNLTGDLSAAWSKLEAYPARFALVVHFVRWAANDDRNPPLEDLTGGTIDAHSLEAGVTLSRWFGREAHRIYAILDEDEADRHRRRLVEMIERKGGAVTVREVQQANRAYSTADAAEGALEDLARAGLGQWLPTPTGTTVGRPTRHFVLHPSDHALSTKPPLAAQQGGFVDVDTDMVGGRGVPADQGATT